jgi:hypothetical protein
LLRVIYYIYRSIPYLFDYPYLTKPLYLPLSTSIYLLSSSLFRFITETSSYTPEGSLEVFADTLFYRYRLDIPYEGKAEYTPLTKDKAGRRDG